MDKGERDLLDEYEYEYEFYRIHYIIISKLLDWNVVERIVDSYKWKKMIIVGGTILAEIVKRSFSKYIEVAEIKDENHSYVETFHVDDDFSEEDIKGIDSDSEILITDIRNEERIRESLARYIDEIRIHYINEVF